MPIVPEQREQKRSSARWILAGCVALISVPLLLVIIVPWLHPLNIKIGRTHYYVDTYSAESEFPTPGFKEWNFYGRGINGHVRSFRVGPWVWQFWVNWPE